MADSLHWELDRFVTSLITAANSSIQVPQSRIVNIVDTLHSNQREEPIKRMRVNQLWEEDIFGTDNKLDISATRANTAQQAVDGQVIRPRGLPYYRSATHQVPMYMLEDDDPPRHISRTHTAINASIPVINFQGSSLPAHFDIHGIKLTRVWPDWFDIGNSAEQGLSTPHVNIDDVYEDLTRIEGNDAALAIGPSMLRDAHLGLYALRDFGKDERLDVYTGPQCATEDEIHWYALIIVPGRNGSYNDGVYDSTIPGPHRYTASDHRCYAYYANDPLGYPYLVNTKLEWDLSLHRAVLVTTSAIRRGQEILLSYGADYWRTYHTRLTAMGLLWNLQWTYGRELGMQNGRVPAPK